VESVETAGALTRGNEADGGTGLLLPEVAWVAEVELSVEAVADSEPGAMGWLADAVPFEELDWAADARV